MRNGKRNSCCGFCCCVVFPVLFLCLVAFIAFGFYINGDIRLSELDRVDYRLHAFYARLILQYALGLVWGLVWPLAHCVLPVLTSALTVAFFYPAGSDLVWISFLHQLAPWTVYWAFTWHWWPLVAYSVGELLWLYSKLVGHRVTFVYNPVRMSMVGDVRARFDNYKAQRCLRPNPENQHGWLATARASTEWFVLKWLLPRGIRIRQPGANYRRFYQQLSGRMHICNSRFENKDNGRRDAGARYGKVQSEFENCRTAGEFCPKRRQIPTCLLSHVDYHLTTDQLSAIVRGHSFLLHHDPHVPNSLGQNFQTYQRSELSTHGGFIEMSIPGGQQYLHPYLQWAGTEQQQEGCLVGRNGAFVWNHIGQLAGTEIVYAYPHDGAYDVADPRNVRREEVLYSGWGKFRVSRSKDGPGSTAPWKYAFSDRVADAPGYRISELPGEFVDQLICLCSSRSYKERNTGTVSRLIDSALQRGGHDKFSNRECLKEYIIWYTARNDLRNNANEGVVYDGGYVVWLYPYYYLLHAAQNGLRQADLREWCARRLLRLQPADVLKWSAWYTWLYWGPLLLLTWPMWSWVNMPDPGWHSPKTENELRNENDDGTPSPQLRELDDMFEPLGRTGQRYSGVPPTKPYPDPALQPAPAPNNGQGVARAAANAVGAAVNAILHPFTRNEPPDAARVATPPAIVAQPAPVVAPPPAAAAADVDDDPDPPLNGVCYHYAENANTHWSVSFQQAERNVLFRLEDLVTPGYPVFRGIITQRKVEKISEPRVKMILNNPRLRPFTVGRLQAALSRAFDGRQA